MEQSALRDLLKVTQRILQKSNEYLIPAKCLHLKAVLVSGRDFSELLEGLRTPIQ